MPRGVATRTRMTETPAALRSSRRFPDHAVILGSRRTYDLLRLALDSTRARLEESYHIRRRVDVPIGFIVTSSSNGGRAGIIDLVLGTRDLRACFYATAHYSVVLSSIARRTEPRAPADQAGFSRDVEVVLAHDALQRSRETDVSRRRSTKRSPIAAGRHHGSPGRPSRIRMLGCGAHVKSRCTRMRQRRVHTEQESVRCAVPCSGVRLESPALGLLHRVEVGCSKAV